MKKIKLFLVIALCCVSAFALVACQAPTEEDLETIESLTKSYITVKGDNEVGVIVDENEKVEEVISQDLTEEEKEVLEEKIEGETIEEAIEEIVEEVVDENKEEEQEVVVDAQNEDEEKANELTEKVKAIVEAVLASKGVDANVSVDTLEDYAELAINLGVSDEQAKLIVLAITLNPSLTFDDVKDLSMSVLIALCDKQEEKVVYASYKTYLKALDALYEEYAYIDELEEKVYELTFKLLEDLTDEEFDATCAELKAAKAEYKETEEKLEAAIEELNTLYASVIEAHEDEKSNKSDNDHKHHDEESFDDYEEDDYYEEYYDDWFEEFDWEEYFKDWSWDDFFIEEEKSATEDSEDEETITEEDSEEKSSDYDYYDSYYDEWDYSFNFGGHNHGHHSQDSSDDNNNQDNNDEVVVASYRGHRF